MQRYARATTWQELAEGEWRQRCEQGCRNAAQLDREISALGVAAAMGSCATTWRPPAAPHHSQPSAPPTVRQMTGWLTRHPTSLTEDEQVQRNAV